MKQKIKPVLLVIFILALGGLVWVHTGSHTESGYTYCGGGGFISQESIDQESVGLDPVFGGVNPGGPCLGQSVTQTSVGRYDVDTEVLDCLLVVAGLASIAVYIVLLVKGRKAPKVASRKKH